PHSISPIPSMSIAQFALDSKQGKLTTGYTIERSTTLYSRPIQGTPCRFRTCYPVTLWPIEIMSASIESLDPVDTRGKWAEAMIRISLRCANETKLSELKFGDEKQSRLIDSLRFYINGEPQLVYPLYEMIFNNSTRVELLPKNGKRQGLTRGPSPIILPQSSIKTVGFASDEGMLPYTARSFTGYRL